MHNMFKFLLNGNISWETKEFLKKLGYQAEIISHFGLSKSKDIEIVLFAQKRKYIIITLDLDFGEIYYFSQRSRAGIIILKLKDQTVESVNQSLAILLKSKTINKEIWQNSLIIFDGKKIRLRKKPEEPNVRKNTL